MKWRNFLKLFRKSVEEDAQKEQPFFKGLDLTPLPVRLTEEQIKLIEERIRNHPNTLYFAETPKEGIIGGIYRPPPLGIHGVILE